MNMNMRIVMNMNIYINKTNEERLNNEPSKSGLINKLLDEYYATHTFTSDDAKKNGHSVSSLRSEWEIPDSSIKQPKKKNPSPAEGLNNFARACCLNKVKPCKHWQWNVSQMVYVNILTGEVREVDA